MFLAQLQNGFAPAFFLIFFYGWVEKVMVKLILVSCIRYIAIPGKMGNHFLLNNCKWDTNVH